MKRIGSFATTLAIGVTLFACWAVGSSAQAQTEQGKATVTATKGSPEYSTGGAYMPLKVGDVLRSGATVRAGGGSQADLSLGKNNGVVRVAENSELALDRLTHTHTGADTVIETQLNLKGGRLLGRTTHKMSTASKYEIKTPVGVAGIRGCGFDIRANGRIIVCDDKVYWVHQASGGQQTPYIVNAGSQFEPGVGISKTPADIADVVCRDIRGIGIGETEAVASVAPIIEQFISPVNITGSRK